MNCIGIIFTGGEYPSSKVIKNLLKDKQALFIAADSGLIAAEEAGIKPDYIIGDMDSVDNARLEKYPAECVIKHKTDKDFTDTELAFSLAVERGCNNIWIIGGGGGRIDHLFAIRSLFERDIFPSRWITKNEDIYCIDSISNEQLAISNEKNNERIVSVFPLGESPWKAASTGLKWELDNVKWNRGFFGLSNVAVNGDFSITSEQGRFMVILNIKIPNKEH